MIRRNIGTFFAFGLSLAMVAVSGCGDGDSPPADAVAGALETPPTDGLGPDLVSYEVGDALPGLIRTSEGTTFVDYVDLVPGAKHCFSLTLSIEPGEIPIEFPTPPLPILFRSLSDPDASGWFTADPREVVFAGYGIPVTVEICFTVPFGEPFVEPPQIQVVVGAGGGLAEGGGVIVRLAWTETQFQIGMWLTDGKFVPLLGAKYCNIFAVMTNPGNGGESRTDPREFHLALLLNTGRAFSRLRIDATLPPDFDLKGGNASRLWIGKVDVTSPDKDLSLPLGRTLSFELTDVQPGTSVFLSVRLHYTRKGPFPPNYLPRRYDFRATVTGDDTSSKELTVSVLGVLQELPEND